MEGDEVIDYNGNCLLLCVRNGVVNYPACYLKPLEISLLQLANSILLFTLLC